MIAERKTSSNQADFEASRHLTWNHWIDLYCETWCVGRNLQVSTIAAYRQTLRQFELWLEPAHQLSEPNRVTTRIVLDYVVYLREQRKNGDSAVQRVIVVLKNFYRAMKAFGHLESDEDPMNGFPKMKKGRVLGKGNRERVIRLNDRAAKALRVYRQARAPLSPRQGFFRTKAGRSINRKVVYERVKKYAALAGIAKRVSPHTLRHTCATHLVRHDVNLVVIRDLLGHRQITSTQIYLHTTAHDVKELAANHPVGKLAPMIADLLEGVRVPIDHPPRRRIVDRAPASLKSRASPQGVHVAG